PSITAKPQTPSANGAPSFSFGHAQASYSFQCDLDGSGFATCTSAKAYSGLADGSHTFKVRGVDANGDTTAQASYTWTVDKTGPVLGTKPSNPSAGTSPSFSYTQGSYSSFACKIDGGSFAACPSPKSFSSLAATSHTFTVHALDA